MKLLITVGLFCKLFSIAIASDYDYLRTRNGIAEWPKYLLNGSPVWTEAEKQKTLAAAVDTGTGTIKDSNFIAFNPEQGNDLATQDIKSENKKMSRSEMIAEIEKRKSKDYNLEKMKDAKKDIDLYLQLKTDYGYDVSKDTTTATTKFNKAKQAYDAAP